MDCEETVQAVSEFMNDGNASIKKFSFGNGTMPKIAIKFQSYFIFGVHMIAETGPLLCGSYFPSDIASCWLGNSCQQTRLNLQDLVLYVKIILFYIVIGTFRNVCITEI
jgi:hypothetical protein